MEHEAVQPLAIQGLDQGGGHRQWLGRLTRAYVDAGHYVLSGRDLAQVAPELGQATQGPAHRGGIQPMLAPDALLEV